MVTNSKNIFESNCEVLVNPVNCVGVMGKGLALQFKNKYPEMFAEYRRDCIHARGGYRKYVPGCCNIHYAKNKQIIANIATKAHWMEKSQMEWVRNGIRELNHIMKVMKYNSVAIPRIGCGLGGLKWETIKPIIKNELKDANYTIWLDGEIIEPKSN